MSQFGMQMPGGQKARRATPDVYTALLFAAIVGLAVAVGLVWRAGAVVGPDGSPLGLQGDGSPGNEIKLGGS